MLSLPYSNLPAVSMETNSLSDGTLMLVPLTRSTLILTKDLTEISNRSLKEAPTTVLTPFRLLPVSPFTEFKF
jgi:hypothetical protein